MPRRRQDHISITTAVLALVSFFLGQLCLAETLGIDPFTNEQYECVREGAVSSNFIQSVNVTTGEKKTLNAKALKRRVRKRISNTLKKRNRIKEIRLKTKKRLRKLLKKVPPPPGSVQTVIDLNQKIDKLTARIVVLKTNVEVLRSLYRRVPDCKKPLQSAGNMRIISNTYTRADLPGVAYFYAILVYEFDHPASDNSRIGCAEIGGLEQRVDSVGSPVFAGPPVIHSLPAVPPQVWCLVFSTPHTCELYSERWTVFLGGVNGRLNPGNCSVPEHCSIEAAVNTLSSLQGQVGIRIVGTTAHNASCK